MLGKNFPSEPPKGFFITKIFHPNVAKNGEICVNTLKKDWKTNYGLKHILLVSISMLVNTVRTLIFVWHDRHMMLKTENFKDEKFLC